MREEEREEEEARKEKGPVRSNVSLSVSTHEHVWHTARWTGRNVFCETLTHLLQNASSWRR